MFTQKTQFIFFNKLELTIEYSKHDKMSYHLIVGHGLPDIDNGFDKEFCFMKRDNYHKENIDIKEARKHWDKMSAIVKQALNNNRRVAELEISILHENGNDKDRFISKRDLTNQETIDYFDRFQPYPYEFPAKSSCSLV